LRDSASVLDAALDSGLPAPATARLFVTHEAMSPGEMEKTGGVGLTLTTDFIPRRSAPRS